MDETLQILLDAYEDAEIQLLSIVARYTLENADLDSESWLMVKLQNIQKLRAELIQTLAQLKQLDSVAAEALTKQYLRGGSSYVEGFIATNEVALKGYIADYTGALRASRFQVLRKTEDAYKRIIFESSMQGVAGIDTRLTTARTALAKFAQNGITGFTSKDGRQYDIRSYVQMASRTALNNAFREGRIRGLEQSSHDLIIVSSVPNPSNLCKPWERKILSISGKSEGYTSLAEAKAAGLFHPNCRHSFSLYTRGLTVIGETDAEKGYDNYEATQQQRHAETKTRDWKRRLTVADTPEEQAKCKAKIKQWRDTTKQIAADNDLRYKPNRVSLVQAR